uniref:Uncharacterized protein n=1 Tax=Mus musculus TaxID=10090 RepID=Q8BY43_MOUSE|nr:unnamed protein product [Mus musculus]BAE34765.1 unnamed protein product [Mus musculus]BAE36052.1 unnamed protein product [Mus musculus]
MDTENMESAFFKKEPKEKKILIDVCPRSVSFISLIFFTCRSCGEAQTSSRLVAITMCHRQPPTPFFKTWALRNVWLSFSILCVLLFLTEMGKVEWCESHALYCQCRWVACDVQHLTCGKPCTVPGSGRSKDPVVPHS